MWSPEAAVHIIQLMWSHMLMQSYLVYRTVVEFIGGIQSALSPTMKCGVAMTRLLAIIEYESQVEQQCRYLHMRTSTSNINMCFRNWNMDTYITNGRQINNVSWLSDIICEYNWHNTSLSIALQSLKASSSVCLLKEKKRNGNLEPIWPLRIKANSQCFGTSFSFFFSFYPDWEHGSRCFKLWTHFWVYFIQYRIDSKVKSRTLPINQFHSKSK